MSAGSPEASCEGRGRLYHRGYRQLLLMLLRRLRMRRQVRLSDNAHKLRAQRFGGALVGVVAHDGIPLAVSKAPDVPDHPIGGTGRTRPGNRRLRPKPVCANPRRTSYRYRESVSARTDAAGLRHS
jgi:hypothetical protein